MKKIKQQREKEMKDKLKQEITEWYENDNEEFIEQIFDKTTDEIIEEVGKKLVNEFRMGNLRQPFIISNEYYVELLLKQIKEKMCERMGAD